jgi:hypothetical protein
VWLRQLHSHLAPAPFPTNSQQQSRGPNYPFYRRRGATRGHNTLSNDFQPAKGFARRTPQRCNHINGSELHIRRAASHSCQEGAMTQAQLAALAASCAGRHSSQRARTDPPTTASLGARGPRRSCRLRACPGPWAGWGPPATPGPGPQGTPVVLRVCVCFGGGGGGSNSRGSGSCDSQSISACTLPSMPCDSRYTCLGILAACTHLDHSPPVR